MVALLSVLFWSQQAGAVLHTQGKGFVLGRLPAREKMLLALAQGTEGKG